MTESGHPALPLVPVRGPIEKASADFWADGEIMIHQTGAAYKVFAACAVGNFNTQNIEPAGVPSGPTTVTTATCQPTTTTSSTSTRPQLFYPKKIPPEVRNLLTGKTLNAESFMAWWRIHVIPRRTLFNPGKWNTPDLSRKQALLQQLGSVRESTAVSCKTSQSLDPVVDPGAGCGGSPQPSSALPASCC